jgi:raffinose/stachyose/melibiose transport system substrate-binding protein
MKRFRPAHVGFALLVIVFVTAAARALWPAKSAPPGGSPAIVIRLAHYQLESGLREAFTAVASAYERKHPTVRVEALPVPSQVFDSWMRVQLVGGQAPDLLQLGTGGVNEDVLARYFVPLSKEAAAPNPYLAQTPLAARPWRETFVDGLQTRPSFNAALFEIYGIPNAQLTVRVFFNRTLWREIFGARPVPLSFAEFQRCCREAEHWSTEKHRQVAAFVTGKQTAALTMDRLFESQTQKTMMDLPGNEAALSIAQERLITLAALRGDWTLESPAIRSGLTLVQETSRILPAGFVQMAREEALMQFVQGRALMILTGVWEAASLRQLAAFPVEGFMLPFPSTDDPEFGRYTIGPLSEGSTNTQAVFGLTRQSAHPEIALDFLRFMTGEEGSKIFSEKSGWPSALIGSRPLPGDEALSPVLEGFPGGFQGFFNLQGSAFSLQRLIANEFNQLVGPRGSVDAFVSAVRPSLKSACIEDCERAARVWRQTTARQDTLLFGLKALGKWDADAEAKASALFAAQTQFDSNAARYAWEVRRARASASAP